MDDDEFKEQMGKLRKFRNESEWFPLAAVAIFWGGLWWNSIELEEPISAILAAIALAGYLIYREIRSVHATILHSQILAARGLQVRI